MDMKIAPRIKIFDIKVKGHSRRDKTRTSCPASFSCEVYCYHFYWICGYL